MSSIPPTNQQFASQNQPSMFPDQQRFFQYQVQHQNQGQAPSFQQNRSARFDDTNAMKLFLQQQALQQNSLQQNSGNPNYQPNARSNTGEENTLMNNTVTNYNSMLQERIRARFNKMKAIPQQINDQNTAASPVINDLTSQQQYMHMMMQRLATNQQLQNGGFPSEVGRIPPNNNNVSLQGGTMGPPGMDNTAIRQTSQLGPNPMVNMQPLYQNATSGMHAYAPQQQFHVPQQYKANASIPHNDPTVGFPPSHSNSNTTTISQSFSKHTSSSSATPNITVATQPKRKQRVSKPKVKESRKSTAAQKTSKSKKIEQTGELANANFINVVSKAENSGKDITKTHNADSHQQSHGSFTIDAENFDFFNMGDFSPDLMDG
ncbi:multicopy suppressor of sta proteins [Saccharomyces pastorianus]|uniref:Multicopy suppressor of sta proteins n=1 Tax=Saccharomyces pastorianus TaxID=27292 RepID=A0A6C1EET1_SACPS|nr:multicopy suppressor of sta proteins [Saccharomyces pastorianus]